MSPDWSLDPQLDEVEVHYSNDHAVKRPVYPGYGFGQTGVPAWNPPPVQDLWDEVRAERHLQDVLKCAPPDEVDRTHGEDELSSDPVLTRRIWTFLQSESPDPTVLDEDGRLAFLHFALYSWDRNLGCRVLLLARWFGVSEAFRCAARFWEWRYRFETQQVYRVERNVNGVAARSMLNVIEALIPLRHGLAADPQAHAEACAFLDEAWDTLPLLHRLALVYLLNDLPRARRFLATGPDLQTIITPTCSYPSVDVEEAWLPLVPLLPPDEVVPHLRQIGEVVPFVPAILLNHGLDALPLLERLGGDGRNGVFRVLASTPHPDALALTLTAFPQKTHGPFLRSAFARWPAIGGEAVRRAVSDPKRRVAALSVAPVTTAADDFDPPGRVATPDELPAILVNPPWTRKTRSLGIKSMSLPAIDCPTVFDWDESSAFYPYPNGADRVLQWLRSGSDVSASSLLQLAPEDFDVVLQHARQVRPNAALAQHVERFGGEAVLALAAQWTSARGVTVLGHVGSVAVVPAILEGLEKKTARDAARAWLDRYPEQAAVGLAPLLFGRAKQPRHQAILAVFQLRAMGHEAVLEAVGARYAAAGAPEVAEAFARIASIEPTDLLPPKLPAIPAYLTPSTAPPPRLRSSDARLDGEAYRAALTMLAISTVEEEYAGLDVLRDVCTPESLEAFAHGAFETWLVNGGEGRESWAMLALGWFGGDEAVRVLTRAIRRWPGEGAAKRAQLGLEVLQRIGTDAALASVYAISEKLKYKSVQKRATELVDVIATSLGLTSLELGDRVVPDLDLDADGTATLDFGPRSFTVRLDEQLKPVLYEGTQVRKSLPKPNQADDEELAKAAKKYLSGLKKDLKTVSAQQIQRLERMMVTGRAVSAEVFRAHFVGHPLVVNLARRLVWRTGNDDATTLFVLDESLQPVDLDDEPVPLRDPITLPHPCDPDAAAHFAAFAERILDYGLLQPFEQLGRRTYDLAGLQVRGDAILGFGIDLPAPTWIHGIEREGFERYDIIDGGAFRAHELAPGGSWSARVEFDGTVAVGFIEPDEQVEVTTLTFFDEGVAVSPDRVPARFLSETLRSIWRAAGRP